MTSKYKIWFYKSTNLQIQGTQQIPKRINTKIFIPKHFMLKLLTKKIPWKQEKNGSPEQCSREEAAQFLVLSLEPEGVEQNYLQQSNLCDLSKKLVCVLPYSEFTQENNLDLRLTKATENSGKHHWYGKRSKIRLARNQAENSGLLSRWTPRS